MGLPFNPDEPSTEGLEVNSSKLEVNVEQVVEWKAVSEENKEVEQATPQNRCIARLVASHMMEKKETKPKQTLPPEKKEMQEEKEMPQEQVCYPQLERDHFLFFPITNMSHKEKKATVGLFKFKVAQN